MESPTTFSDVSYSILEEDIVSDIHLFSVTLGPLPSFIRTLSPKSRQSNDTRNEQDEVNEKSQYCLTDIRCLVLMMTFLVTSILTVYFIASKYWQKDFDSLLTNQTKTLSMEYLSLETNVSETDAEESITYQLDPFQSTRCVTKCIPYRGRRFDSHCIGGFCSCAGRYYQQHTCLPSVDGCIIERHTGVTFMENLMVPSYSCQASPSTHVHVISVYGNHFSEKTVINFHGYRATSNLTVVLGSHYPIRWKLEFSENIDIQNIVLASDRNTLSRDVDIGLNSYNKTLPDISRIRIPVGYGDDRHDMDTVKMLQIIKEKYGQIHSFTGTEFADYIDIKFSRP